MRVVQNKRKKKQDINLIRDYNVIHIRVSCNDIFSLIFNNNPYNIKSFLSFFYIAFIFLKPKLSYYMFAYLKNTLYGYLHLRK